MNSFEKGFIKRAMEYGLSEKEAAGLGSMLARLGIREGGSIANMSPLGSVIRSLPSAKQIGQGVGTAGLGAGAAYLGGDAAGEASVKGAPWNNVLEQQQGMDKDNELLKMIQHKLEGRNDAIAPAMEDAGLGAVAGGGIGALLGGGLGALTGHSEDKSKDIHGTRTRNALIGALLGGGIGTIPGAGLGAGIGAATSGPGYTDMAKKIFGRMLNR